MKVTWLSCLKKKSHLLWKADESTHVAMFFLPLLPCLYRKKEEKLLDIGKDFMKHKLQLSKCS